jgi:CspA family cold shock protein
MDGTLFLGKVSRAIGSFACPDMRDLRVERAVRRSGSLHALSGMSITMRITGTVKFYNSSKGFGFIQPEDGSKDVFVHATALERAGIRTLNEGDRVSFELEDDRKGRGKQAGRIQMA